MTEVASELAEMGVDGGGSGESHRPALEKAAQDLVVMERDLLSGFQSRRHLLLWLQRLSIRTLGQVPDDWYRKVGTQLRGSSGGERASIDLLLKTSVQSTDVDSASVMDYRERLTSLLIRPSLHRVVRHLRADAGEYVDSERSSVSKHDPERQRYVAMRPALTELEGRQRHVLLRLVDGFDDVPSLMEWTGDVEVATHGEIRDDWTERVVSERSTRRVMLSGEPHDRQARELLAGTFLLPAFNAGARDLYGRSKESPDAEATDNEAPDW